jgi:hypothetical protein
MRIPVILFAAATWLLPLEAGAAKVAIAKVDYTLLQPGDSREAAAQVEGKVAEGAREAGFEPVRGALVVEAVRGVPACAEKERAQECLAAVAEKLGADEAVAVAVTDDEHASYRVEVTFARRDAVADERTAGFFVVLEWVRGAVALALQRPAPESSPQPVPQPASSASQPSPASPVSAVAPVPAVPPPADSGPAKPLHRAVFWTGVGVTGALLVAFAATDAATNARYNDLEAESPAARSQDDWDAARRLQVADRALLGCTLAAAAATTVIFFFTDFEGTYRDRTVSGGDSSGAPPVSVLAPFATTDGAGLILQGRF